MNTRFLLSLIVQWHCIVAEDRRTRSRRNTQLRSAGHQHARQPDQHHHHHQQQQQQHSRSLFSWQGLPMDIKNFWSSLTGASETTGSPIIDPEEDGYAYMIVKVKSDAGRDVIFDMLEVEIEKEFPNEGYIAVRVADEHLDAVVEQLEVDPNIENYEENGIYTEQGTLDYYETEEEARRRQLEDGETIPYGITMTEGDQVSIGYSPVTVCIVDTGVARGHPDMNADLLSGSDRISNVDETLLQWYNDTRGHGTHIAGTVSAKADNGIGVRGMGDIPLFIARGLNNNGKARESDILESIEQCEAAGAKIVSLSLSGSSLSSAMKTAIDRIYGNGGLVIAASGNQNSYREAMPASDPSVISVAAVNASEVRWKSSNYGPWVEIAAPGEKIFSTVVRGRNMAYAYYSGTSMAVPHVAAAAALVWSHHPECTNVQIRYALAYTAKDIGNAGCDDDYGYGIVKTKKALDFINQYGCTGVLWGQKSSPDGKCSSIDAFPATRWWWWKG